MKHLTKTVSLLAAGLLFSSAASAAVITYDFTGNGDATGDPLTYTVDGVTLDVYGAPGISVQTDYGLGVSAYEGDDTQLEGGWFYNEWLSFVFDDAVTLLSVTFANVDWNDDFEFIANGYRYSDVDIPSSGTYVFNNEWQGNNFTFGSDFVFDNCYIAGIEVSVPAPGALILLLLGLAGMFGARRLKA